MTWQAWAFFVCAVVNALAAIGWHRRCIRARSDLSIMMRSRDGWRDEAALHARNADDYAAELKVLRARCRTQFGSKDRQPANGERQ